MLGKKCSKCKEWKGLDCFYNRKDSKDKKRLQCKECQKKHQKKYYQENKKERNEYSRKYQKEHIEERRQYDREYYQEYRKKKKQRDRKYQQKNKERIARYQKRYKQNHKEQRHQYDKNKRITDPLFRLNCIMSTAISQVRTPSIKNGRAWKDLVPYTLIELRKHLKKTLPEGYTWEDLMQGKLHIDHILPIAIFEYEKAEDLAFQICWNLDNLRLLPVKENLRKHAKLIKPFQKHFDIEVNIKK